MDAWKARVAAEVNGWLTPDAVSVPDEPECSRRGPACEDGDRKRHQAIDQRLLARKTEQEPFESDLLDRDDFFVNVDHPAAAGQEEPRPVVALGQVRRQADRGREQRLLGQFDRADIGLIKPVSFADPDQRRREVLASLNRGADRADRPADGDLVAQILDVPDHLVPGRDVTGVEYGERERRDREHQQRVVQANRLQPEIDRLSRQLRQYRSTAFTGSTLIIDDEDLERVTLLKPKKGHGSNPDGSDRGYRNDVGDRERVANLSGGRYTWFANVPGEDTFTWNPSTTGRYRLWISWGVHGSGVHTRDARYWLDNDGDLATRDDQTEVARADQFLFAGVSGGESEKKPLWSGLADAGVHDFQPSTRIVLRGGDTGTGITADVIVLQAVEDSEDETLTAQTAVDRQPRHAVESKHPIPRLRGPVSAQRNVESFSPLPAKFVRFTSLETIDENRHQPCLDELEVFTAEETPTNVALASRGGKASSSGNYSETGIHQLKHINDGRFGNSHSWISNEYGRGWVQIELADVCSIDSVVWSRDREAEFQDRLPVRYTISTSLDGLSWEVVASSADRVPPGTPHDDSMMLMREVPAADTEKLASLTSQWESLRQQQKQLLQPRMVYAGKFRDPETTFVLHRGDPEQPAEKIQPRVLSAIGSLQLPAGTPDQKRRLALATWIASQDHPLTARVMVNRVWQHHFGTGLVETSSDFGLNGGKPTHPKLLDWLSGEFIRNGWSVKYLHRLIMTSETYQRSAVWSAARPPTSQTVRQDSSVRVAPLTQHPSLIDADGKWLWRFPSRRLEAEAIRDSILQVSGNLNRAMGGPGFDFFKSRGGLTGFPPLESFDAAGLRRMIYAHKVRMEKVPVFGAFDCPDAGLPAPERSQSTTAIQALNLFNSPFVIEQADAFAARVARESDHTVAGQIQKAYEIALGRAPTPDEIEQIGPVVESFGISTLCRVLINSNEFLFIP